MGRTHERRRDGPRLLLIALALMMAANRSGYVYFVVGPSSVLVAAGVVAAARIQNRSMAK
jgi:hypothetical protein